jgi:(R)-2-hydroxyacyl-CoA dehydratese activating ATPase
MRTLGIDIGSRTVKVAVLEDGHLDLFRKSDSSYDPISVAMGLIKDISYDSMTATGYGRHNFKAHFDCPVISEIKAFGKGACFLFPEAEAVLDIGGQDTKVIALDTAGRVSRFEMNDRCAAGTGRFMEIMANALHYTMEEFGAVACIAEKAEKISSMCTVFAESEVVSLISGGASRQEVALGIHESIASRALTMLGKLSVFSNLVFAGGVAYNSCMQQLLRKYLGVPILVPADPQLVGALGAALEGATEKRLFTERETAAFSC